MERLRASAGFREAMLSEAVDCLLDGELEIGKSVLRDYVNATIGFEELSTKVDIPPKSLMRMLGPNGNPQMSNLFAVIGALQSHAGVRFQTTNVLSVKARRLEKAERARLQGRKEHDPPDKMARYAEDTYEARMAFEEEVENFKRR